MDSSKVEKEELGFLVKKLEEVERKIYSAVIFDVSLAYSEMASLIPVVVLINYALFSYAPMYSYLAAFTWLLPLLLLTYRFVDRGSAIYRVVKAAAAASFVKNAFSVMALMIALVFALGTLLAYMGFDIAAALSITGIVTVGVINVVVSHKLFGDVPLFPTFLYLLALFPATLLGGIMSTAMSVTSIALYLLFMSRWVLKLR